MAEENGNSREQRDVGLYEKLAARTAEILEEGKKTLSEALEKAKEELSGAGEFFSREHAEKIGAYVLRDLSENAGKAREAMVKALDPHRVTAGVQSVFARILASTGETLSELADIAERGLEFHTGEVTSPGTLTCRDCGAEVHMTRTSRIPPCAKCHKTAFRKSY